MAECVERAWDVGGGGVGNATMERNFQRPVCGFEEVGTGNGAVGMNVGRMGWMGTLGAALVMVVGGLGGML